MSDQSLDTGKFFPKNLNLVEFDIDITNGYDLGTVAIHKSRHSIPAYSAFIPFMTGYVGSDELVGPGASVAVGTDDVTTDPDNILNTTEITGLDAANDCITPAIGTAIVNNTASAVPIYYNVSAAALTAGVLKVAGFLVSTR
jgi:hypothetical protein